MVSAIAAIVLVARSEEPTIAGLSGYDLASLAYKIGLLLVAGAAALVLFRERLSRALVAALVWVLIALALVFGYGFRFELRNVADRLLGQFMPGRAITHGRTVTIVKDNVGSFAVLAEINGVRVPMVLDTGATAVVLTPEAAKAAGLPIEVL